MTRAEHVSHFLRLAADGPVPDELQGPGETQPMEVDLPPAVPFSDDFSDGEPTKPEVTTHAQLLREWAEREEERTR